MMNGSHLPGAKPSGGKGLIMAPGSGYVATAATTPSTLHQAKNALQKGVSGGKADAGGGIKDRFNLLYLRTLAAILRIAAVILAVIILICLGCVALEYQPGHGFVNFTAAMALIVMFIVGCLYCFSLPFVMLGFSSLIWCSILLAFNAIWALFYFIGGIICIAAAEDNKDCIPHKGCKGSRDSYGAAVFFCWVAAIVHAVLAWLAWRAVSLVKQATITPVGTLQRGSQFGTTNGKHTNGNFGATNGRYTNGNSYGHDSTDNRGFIDKMGDKIGLGGGHTNGYGDGYDVGGNRIGYVENGRGGVDNRTGRDVRGGYGPRGDDRNFLEKMGDKIGLGDRDDNQPQFDSRGNRIVYNTREIRTGSNVRPGYGPRDDRNFLEKVGDKIGLGDRDDNQPQFDSRGNRIIYNTGEIRTGSNVRPGYDPRDDRNFLEKVGDKIGLGDRDDNRPEFDSRGNRIVYNTGEIRTGSNVRNGYSSKDDRSFLEKVGDKVGLGDRDDNRPEYDARGNRIVYNTGEIRTGPNVHGYGPRDDRNFIEKVGDKIGLGDHDNNRPEFDARGKRIVYNTGDIRTGQDIRGGNVRYGPKDDRNFLEKVGDKIGLEDSDDSRPDYDARGNRIVYNTGEIRTGQGVRGGNVREYGPKDDRNFLEKIGDKIGIGDDDHDNRPEYDARGNRIIYNTGDVRGVHQVRGYQESRDDRNFLEKVGDKIGFGDGDRDNRSRAYTDDEMRAGYDVRGNRIIRSGGGGGAVRSGQDVHGNTIHYDGADNRIIYNPNDTRPGPNIRGGPGSDIRGGGPSPGYYPGGSRTPGYEVIDNRGGTYVSGDGRSSVPRRVANADGVSSVVIG